MIKKEHFCKYFVEKFYKTGNSLFIAGSQYGFISPRLAYIVSGSCLMESLNGFSLKINQDEIWYLPARQGYKSYWSPIDNVIEFYYIEVEADMLNLLCNQFQKIQRSDLKDVFIELYNEDLQITPFHSPKNIFYLLNEIYPYLKKDKNKNIATILPAMNYIHENYANSFKVDELAKLCHVSLPGFYSIFKSVIGMSPIAYKNLIKINHALALMKSGRTLEEICELLNYCSPAFLRKMIISYTGKTPKQIKNENRLYTI